MSAENDSLESLKALKKVFDEADEDGSGELDIDEFCTKLGPHLGVNLKRQQVAQLFLKIDADAGGTVDWDEFTNFMFLLNVQNHSDEMICENWRLFPPEHREKSQAGCHHKDLVERIVYCAAIDKYISCGRDGSFQLWSPTDLKHVKTVGNGSSWITDCAYMPNSRKLVFTAQDRAISFYDTHRGSYELSGRVYASGIMGVPLCMDVLAGDSGERIVYGDSKGCATLLLCGTRELPARDLISTFEHKDYLYLHKEHKDWITKLKWVPELGLVTASLDSTIKIFDINRDRIMHDCTHHSKGVHSFVYSRAYSIFASCGQERDVIVWQANTGRRMGELRGHTSSVVHIELDERVNQVFTLGVDKVIKVWDLRNHKCMQTINREDWLHSEDSKAHCFTYDHKHRHLVTATNRPYTWQHKILAQDKTGHREPLRGALYNATFHVAVSADEGGTVCVWNMQDGSREGRFEHAHGNSKLTAMSFDKNERRLVTAANDASIHVWNFNNGSLLRRFAHSEEQLEISAVMFAWDRNRSADSVYAAGWNCKVFVWDDCDEDVVTEFRAFEGHREDITAMAIHPVRKLLATGDYEGKIFIWNLFTGEKKSVLCHRAERYETSVERLQWLPAYSSQQRREAAAAAAARRAAAMKARRESGASSAQLSARRHVETNAISHHLAAAGIPFVPTAVSAQARASSADSGGAGQGGTKAGSLGSSSSSTPQAEARRGSITSSSTHQADARQGSISTSSTQQQQQQQQQQQHAPASTSSREATPSAAPPAAPDEERPSTTDSAPPDLPEPSSTLLLSGGGDGLVRVWQISRLGTGQLLCTLPGAQGCMEVVSASCSDARSEYVVFGDTSGHVRVWDVSQGIDAQSAAACSASFKLRSHWRAHEAGISSVDFVRGKAILITASKDCNCAVWTLDGGLVGIFGEHSWDLDTPSSWKDPFGMANRPLLEHTEALYQVNDEPDAPAQAQQQSTSMMDELLLTRAGLDGCEATTPAKAVLYERKQRKHDVLTSMPMQPHGRLHLHGIAEAPEGVAALLKSAAEKRRQRTRSNYSNMSSVNSSMTKASRGSSWRRSSGV